MAEVSPNNMQGSSLLGASETNGAGFPFNFKNEIPWLCSAFFPDPSEVQVLVLCDSNRLLLPYTDSFPSSLTITCNECVLRSYKCVFSFFSRKINNGHAPRTKHAIFPSTSLACTFCIRKWPTASKLLLTIWCNFTKEWFYKSNKNGHKWPWPLTFTAKTDSYMQ